MTDDVTVIRQPVPWRATRTKAKREAIVEAHVGTRRRLRVGDELAANVEVLALEFVPRLGQRAYARIAGSRFTLPPTEVELVVRVLSAPIEVRRALKLGG
jgi:hypothetical protein